MVPLRAVRSCAQLEANVRSTLLYRFARAGLSSLCHDPGLDVACHGWLTFRDIRTNPSVSNGCDVNNTSSWHGTLVALGERHVQFKLTRPAAKDQGRQAHA
jgi:hypothetical protein